MTFVVVEGPKARVNRRWCGGSHHVARRRAGRVDGAGAGRHTHREAARKTGAEIAPRRAFGAELFLFLAARADLVERVIRPALDSGQVVIADRFGLSTIAYQVAGRGLPRPDVEAALRVATGGLVPDLTLILDIPVTVGRERQRSAGKAQDRIEREDDTFHTRVRDAYRSASGPGIVHIDASQPKKAVQDAAWREVAAATGALSLRST